ncbi:helix-turn-helix domain-containing protein [Longispora sp. NPDC051575]|uniref:helix-turn-helix transcriptional regulator n=1 Tax=Longispora sp. NPDC051575 TaxID=3154943 RepID=UPI003429641B
MVEHLLAPVGLSAADSETYLHILGTGAQTAPEIAAALHLSPTRMPRILRRLSQAGLVNRMVGAPPRYFATPPDAAVDALVVQHQHSLEELRAHARELTSRVRADATRPSEVVELVDGPEAVFRALSQLEYSAREEVLIIDAPPYLGGVLFNDNELQALARGVRYRGVYHAPVLAEPGKMAHLERYIAAGEQARVLPDIKMKMLIADHRGALVPLNFDSTQPAVRLLVHPSPLLDALIVCFESIWDRAVPLGPATDAAPAGELDDRDRSILRMMAAGHKDAAIGRALQITQRTVVRRIAELMRHLEVDTRFQAGVQAARRGWL